MKRVISECRGGQCKGEGAPRFGCQTRPCCHKRRRSPVAGFQAASLGADEKAQLQGAMGGAGAGAAHMPLHAQHSARCNGQRCR
jgi:hypothetical protein